MAQQLIRLNQMAQISAAKIRASIARTRLVHRASIRPKLCITQIQTTFPAEDRPMPCQPCRQHAIKSGNTIGGDNQQFIAQIVDIPDLTPGKQLKSL